jgi:hypothetical protein
MRRLFDIRAAALGTTVAAAACAASFAIAALGLGNLYYASVFMPVAMLGCLSIAWFSFLRDDGFARRKAGSDVGDPDGALPEPAPAEPVAVQGLGRSCAASDIGDVARRDVPPGHPDASMYVPRNSGLVPRRPLAGSATGRSGVSARAALVWAAVEIGAVAALLYSVAGVGSRFY